MSIEIVYDRKFIRCGDRFIPFCLYGSNNCTQFNYRTGREILERSWSTFTYGDDMLLATADDLMAIVRKYNPGPGGEHFRWRGELLSDEQVVKFYEQGIKGAVTVEELIEQTGSTVHCDLGAYEYNDDADQYPEQDRFLHTTFKTRFDTYPRTTGELVDWINRMKEEKAAWLKTGKVKYVYIQVRYTSIEPITCYPVKQINGPCIARGRYGYIVDASPTSVSYDKEAKRAKVFPDSETAYLYVRQNRNAGAIRLSPWKEPTPGVVISVLRGGTRIYVQKLTRKHLYFAYTAKCAKQFASEAIARAWADKHLWKYPSVSDPIAEVCSA